ncbi:uncharacterized protein LOC144034827 [Vanacampus margaritifer]
MVKQPTFVDVQYLVTHNLQRNHSSNTPCSNRKPRKMDTQTLPQCLFLTFAPSHWPVKESRLLQHADWEREGPPLHSNAYFDDDLHWWAFRQPVLFEDRSNIEHQAFGSVPTPDVLVAAPRKMTTIFRITLLISLTSSCVCETSSSDRSIPERSRDLTPVVDVNGTRDSYRARENDNITLGWKFSSYPNTSLTSLRIHCELLREGEVTVLFQLRDGVAVHLVGRVQCNRDALRRGQISLQLSRLRMEDSGVYQCQVNTSTGVKSGKYRVIVTASAVDGTPASPRADNAHILKGLLLVAAAAVAAAAIAAGYLLSLTLL